eukprot:jgi/Chlat1/5176/Chrsp33S05040
MVVDVDMTAAEPAESQPPRFSRTDKGKAVVGVLSAKAQAALENAPWVEKYRPRSLGDVAAHSQIIDTIGKLTREGRLPHLLLYGPPGTGKTSTVLAVARQLYGDKYQNMTLELNASDDRGIDVVRNQIQDFASTRTIFSSGLKLIILDEADAMTKDAQFSLRRIIEKYTRNTRFCLICNYVSKIIPALQSRCTRFRFAPLDRVHIVERLRHVISEESVNIIDEGLEAIVRLSGGDMRRALNILQSTHMSAPQVDEKAVYLCTGNPLPQDIEQIVHWLLNEPFSVSHSRIQELKMLKGLALTDVVQQLQPWVFRLSLPADVRINLIDALSNIEYRLSAGTSEKLQLGSLIGAFTHARIAVVAAAG